MKKIFCIFCIMCTMVLGIGFFCGFSVPQTTAYAAELTSTEETPEVSENTPTAPQTETVLTRAESWFYNNFLETLATIDLGAVVALIISQIISNRKNKKNKDDISNSVKSNNESNTAVVDSVNKLIEEHNDELVFLGQLKENGIDLITMVKEMVIYSKSVLEILSAVYANNKNIPQATKDLVQLKYVEALKKEAAMKAVLSIEGSASEETEEESAATEGA